MSEYVPPETVKIGYMTYDVRQQPEVWSDGGRRWGTHSSVDQAITLQSDASDERKREVFIHEVLHAVGTLFEAKLKERQITVLANGLAGYFRDNPDGGGFLP